MTIAYSGDSITYPDLTVQATAPKVGMVNRIINGAMVIDQRNAGASVTPVDGQFGLDRWKFGLGQASKFTTQQNAGSVTPPTGFANYLGITSSSAYSIVAGDYFNFQQRLEGFNTADLAWGTASAATVTISFLVRSSITGTFGGALSNSASNRSYPFTYTISAANTWEQKSVTIAGDTGGTWSTTNGIGILMSFGFGVGSTYSGTAGAWAGAYYLSATGATSVVGTSGATFYITGVQLEKGSTATSFDYRPYGTELALCQRYYYKIVSGAGNYPCGFGGYQGVNLVRFSYQLPSNPRSAPSVSANAGSGAIDYFYNGGNTGSLTVNAVEYGSGNIVIVDWNATGAVVSTIGYQRIYSTTAFIAFSMEL